MLESRQRVKRLLDVRSRSRELRKEQTPAEMMLWETLRNRKLLDRKFRRQFPVDCFILDFYCEELKLCIELDGGIHDEPHQAAHDENRDGYLHSLGITILRFPNEAVLHDLKTVLLNIAEEIDRLAKA
jgi:very-short-patch-repair endonuclease